jgi:hypothetical protein
VPELQLGTFLRGSFSQGPGYEQKMTHWRFIAEYSAGGGHPCMGRDDTGSNSHRHLAGRPERVVQSRHPIRMLVRVIIVCVV